MQNPKKLRVWHLAYQLALKVVRALPVARARTVPNLRSQAIRAATSIHWNIAEGCKRETRPQFLNQLGDALCSADELESELQFARDTEIIAEGRHAELQNDVDLVRKLLFGLMRTVRARIEEEKRDAVDAVDNETHSRHRRKNDSK